MPKCNKQFDRLLQLFVQKNVFVDGRAMDKVEICEPTGKGEHTVVILSWKEKGVAFSIKLTEDSLFTADIQEFAIDTEDHEGDQLSVTFSHHNGKPVKLK